MFTGIIESVGEICNIDECNGLLHLAVRSSISHELHPDQSVAHQGMCLTVTRVEHDIHYVTLVPESLRCSHPSKWKPGCILNLERCMKADGRFDGHFVTGHVDCVAEVREVLRLSEEAMDVWISLPNAFEKYVVYKGSITVDGVSLTVAECTSDAFRVSIIPYTLHHTSLNQLQSGFQVHLEFDILAKYIEKQWRFYQQNIK